MHVSARLALEVAAVIYYARPFTKNERAPQKKSKRRPAKGAPHLGKVKIALQEVLSKEDRRLHYDVLFIRNNIVAHANARYFPVRLVQAFLPSTPERLGDFALKARQTFPRLDLKRLRKNAKQLHTAFSIHASAAATEMRRTRKRLRRK